MRRSGVSHQACLEAAVETGWYSLAQIAITPAGWFDLGSRKPLDTEGGIKDLARVLSKARDAGVGLIAMKAALAMAASPYTGSTKRDEDSPRLGVFDKYYADNFLKADLSPFQRSYAYVLAHGVDAVNSDMQNFKHFEQNIIAAQTSHTYFA